MDSHIRLKFRHHIIHLKSFNFRAVRKCEIIIAVTQDISVIWMGSVAAAAKSFYMCIRILNAGNGLSIDPILFSFQLILTRCFFHD